MYKFIEAADAYMAKVEELAEFVATSPLSGLKR